MEFRVRHRVSYSCNAIPLGICLYYDSSTFQHMFDVTQLNSYAAVLVYLSNRNLFYWLISRLHHIRLGRDDRNENERQKLHKICRWRKWRMTVVNCVVNRHAPRNMPVYTHTHTHTHMVVHVACVCIEVATFFNSCCGRLLLSASDCWLFADEEVKMWMLPA